MNLPDKLYNELLEVLEECEEYMDNRADADWQGDPGRFIPNKEAQLQSEILEVLEKIKIQTV